MTQQTACLYNIVQIKKKRLFWANSIPIKLTRNYKEPNLSYAFDLLSLLYLPIK